MGVDFPERRVLAKRAVDGRKPASGHESQLRQGVASGHPEGRSATKEPRSGLTRRNTLTLDPTCCGFSHSLFAIYARLYAAVNIADHVGEFELAVARMANDPAMDIADAPELLGRASNRLGEVREMLRKARRDVIEH